MRVWKRLAGIVERSPEKPLDQSEMRSWPFLTMVLIGVSISVPFFAFGGQLGQKADFVTVVIGIVIASFLLGVWGVITGYVGVTARLPTAIILRRTFGTKGSLAIVCLMILISFCWFGLQTQILVESVAAILKTQFDYTLDKRIGIGVIGALIATTAIIGVNAMGKVARISVPLLLLAALIPLSIGIDRYGIGALVAPRDLVEPFSLGMVISVAVGAEVFGCSINPDLSRFLRTPRDNALAMFINYGIAFPALLILAAGLGIIYNNADLVETMTVAGIAVPGLLVIILATWTSNDKNLYASGLSLSALFPKVDRWKLATLAGVVGTCLAAADILGNFITWLTFMGLLIAPMSGVYVTDFLLERGRYAAHAPEPPRFRPIPLLAWIIGILVGVATLPAANFGFGLLSLTNAPTVDALLAAMIALALLRLLVPRHSGKEADTITNSTETTPETTR